MGRKFLERHLRHIYRKMKDRIWHREELNCDAAFTARSSKARMALQCRLYAPAPIPVDAGCREGGLDEATLFRRVIPKERHS